MRVYFRERRVFNKHGTSPLKGTSKPKPELSCQDLPEMQGPWLGLDAKGEPMAPGQ